MRTTKEEFDGIGNLLSRTVTTEESGYIADAMAYAEPLKPLISGDYAVNFISKESLEDKAKRLELQLDAASEQLKQAITERDAAIAATEAQAHLLETIRRRRF